MKKKEQKFNHIFGISFDIGEIKSLSRKEQTALIEKIEAFINKQTNVKCIKTSSPYDKDASYPELIDSKYALTKDELDKLKVTLEKLENSTFYSTGLNKISGGFAKAEMFNYDEEIIDVTLTWGYYDGDSHTETEQIEIDRETMKVID